MVAVAIVMMGVFVVARPASAIGFEDILNTVARIVAAIAYGFIAVFGKLILVLFSILIQVAKYNDFLNAAAVEIGWRIVKDIANMFFILVLLVIAFGTAFRYQPYRYNALLRRLIIMAVLVNFSNIIAAFFIDFMQVIMMTFVNAIADAAAGNLSNTLGLREMLALDPNNSGGDVTYVSVAGTLILGLIMVIIALAVVLVYVLMLLFRIIALWVLIILSPLAYLFSTFPGTRAQSGKYWNYFWRYAVVGPALAFFLWLTLTITQATTASRLITDSADLSSTSRLDTSQGGNISAALSSISSDAGILGYMVGIILLVMGLKVASQFGTAGGGMAANLANDLQKRGLRAKPFAATNALLGGAYARTLQRPLEAGAKWTTAKIGGSRYAPILNNYAARANARISKMQKEREEKKAAWVDTADLGVMRRIANSSTRLATPQGVAERKRARKRAPSLIRSNADFRETLAEAERENFLKYTPKEIERITNKLQSAGYRADVGRNEFLGDVLPQEVMRSFIQSSSADKLQRAGYYDPAVRKRWHWDDTRGEAVAPAGSTMGTVPVPIASGDSDLYTKYQAGVDDEKFRATQQAIARRHGGDMEKFFAGAEYAMRPGDFLARNEYEQASRRQKLQAEAIAGGRLQANAMTGTKKALARGQKGDAAKLFVNFQDAALKEIGDLLGGEGAHLTGESQKRAAAVLATKFGEQRQSEEIDRRMRELTSSETQRRVASGEIDLKRAFVDEEMEKEGGRRYEQVAYQLALQGRRVESEEERQRHREQIARDLEGEGFREKLEREAAETDLSAYVPPARFSAGEQQRFRTQAEAEVQADATLQERLAGETSDFRAALENAESIDLHDKLGLGSIRQTYRHEDAHGQLEGVSDADREAILGKLTPARRKALEQQIRTTWSNGKQMSPKQMGEEILAELYGSKGKAGAGKLPFTEDEAKLFGELTTTLEHSSLERARSEVDSLTDDAVDAIYNQLAPARQRAIEGFIDTKWSPDEQLGQPAKKREFLREALVVHRAKMGPRIVTAEDGTTAESPLSFRSGEADLALLVHAAAKKRKVLVTTTPLGGGEAEESRGAVSASELTSSRRPSIVPEAPGVRRVTAAPRERAVPRRPEASIAPMTTSVFNNASIRNMANDIQQKLSTRIDSMPSRQELLYQLNQLGDMLRQVAKVQGVQDKRLDDMHAELSSLQGAAAGPGQEKDVRMLRDRVAKFLKRLEHGDDDNADDEEEFAA